MTETIRVKVSKWVGTGGNGFDGPRKETTRVSTITIPRFWRGKEHLVGDYVRATSPAKGWTIDAIL